MIDIISQTVYNVIVEVFQAIWKESSPRRNKCRDSSSFSVIGGPNILTFSRLFSHLVPWMKEEDRQTDRQTDRQLAIAVVFTVRSYCRCLCSCCVVKLNLNEMSGHLP